MRQTRGEMCDSNWNARPQFRRVLLLTSRPIDTDGNVTYTASESKPAWISIYAVFPGDAIQSAATSRSVQARWVAGT